MSKRNFAFAAAIVVACLAALVWFWRPAAVAVATKLPGGGDFVLQSAGGPFDSASLRGQVMLVYFGYTYCPDICPTSLAITGEAMKRLAPDELARLRLVFVSVDPQRDTPARLKDYVEFFHPNMIGVTGSAEQIAATARKYGAAYARTDVNSAAGYVVDHSAWTYVVAPDGRLVGRIPHGATVEQTLAEIRKWLPATPTSKGPT
ncbi:MAG: SCO family protein [Rhodocyclales bacterium]|nr:SCO family protein [Rhodocyclales bacterium]MBI5784808.1 SCO family protein [Rhodocyclales bacterium]